MVAPVPPLLIGTVPRDRSPTAESAKGDAADTAMVPTASGTLMVLSVVNAVAKVPVIPVILPVTLTFNLFVSSVSATM